VNGPADDAAVQLHRQAQAASLLLGAAEYLADAKRVKNSTESRFLLAYQAALHALNAILLVGGASANDRQGSHRQRIDAARELAPNGADLLERIDAARLSRNKIAYGGGAVEAGLLSSTLGDVASLIELANSFIREQPF
jgi:hypothetical protein